MSNRDLLKEAIADAEAVKEMAISNAKAALEEAFTPQLQSMLAKKLTEMEDEDEKKDMEEAKMHDKEADTMSEEELNELLSELEEEESEESEETEKEETESKEEEEEDFDLEEMDEEALKAFIEEVVDEMIEAGELEAGEKETETPEMEAPEEVADEEPMEEPMMEAEEDEEEKMEEAKKAHDEDEKKHMEEELAEAIKVIKTLKAELHEVNLLNSKLLYTNKIFKAKNLTEAQKVKVLTTFDKAETVKEVKLVYETLSEGLVTSTVVKKEALKESKSYASKAVGVSPKQPVVETNDMVNRFKKLAGIK